MHTGPCESVLQVRDKLESQRLPRTQAYSQVREKMSKHRKHVRVANSMQLAPFAKRERLSRRQENAKECVSGKRSVRPKSNSHLEQSPKCHVDVFWSSRLYASCISTQWAPWRLTAWLQNWAHVLPPWSLQVDAKAAIGITSARDWASVTLGFEVLVTASSCARTAHHPQGCAIGQQVGRSQVKQPIERATIDRHIEKLKCVRFDQRVSLETLGRTDV